MNDEYVVALYVKYLDIELYLDREGNADMKIHIFNYFDAHDLMIKGQQRDIEKGVSHLYSYKIYKLEEVK